MRRKTNTIKNMKLLLALTAGMLAGFAPIHAGGDKDENEKEIAVKDLPEAVLAAIQAKFPKGEIEEAEVIETKDGKVYEVEVEVEAADDEVEYEVMVSAAGKILSVEKEDDDDDDDDDGAL